MANRVLHPPHPPITEPELSKPRPRHLPSVPDAAAELLAPKPNDDRVRPAELAFRAGIPMETGAMCSSFFHDNSDAAFSDGRMNAIGRRGDVKWCHNFFFDFRW
jgi:hypothetical protein